MNESIIKKVYLHGKYVKIGTVMNGLWSIVQKGSIRNDIDCKSMQEKIIVQKLIKISKPLEKNHFFTSYNKGKQAVLQIPNNFFIRLPY